MLYVGAASLAPHPIPESIITTTLIRRGASTFTFNGRARTLPDFQLRSKNRAGSVSRRRFHLPQTVCSSRNPGRPRAPLMKGRILSNESLRAVRDLKGAKEDSERLAEVFRVRISRLLKADLLAVLAELQRQEECDLALQVFELARKEVWYKPDVTLYAAMLATLNRNKLIEEVENLFNVSKEEGLQPHAHVYIEVLGAYMRSGMPLKALEVYDDMKSSGCFPFEAYAFLIKGLEICRLPDLAAAVKEDYVHASTMQLEEIPMK